MKFSQKAAELPYAKLELHREAWCLGDLVALVDFRF